MHEIASITPSGQATQALGYDARGNLTLDPTQAQAQQYAWDTENRLASAQVGPVVGSYVYDALGRRLAKSAQGTTRIFVHDGAQVIAEYTAPTLTSASIGNPAPRDRCQTRNGIVTVTGAGTDIWGASDQCQYAYETLSGNGSMTLCLRSQTDTNPWAKVGPHDPQFVGAQCGLCTYSCYPWQWSRRFRVVWQMVSRTRPPRPSR